MIIVHALVPVLLALSLGVAGYLVLDNIASKKYNSDDLTQSYWDFRSLYFWITYGTLFITLLVVTILLLSYAIWIAPGFFMSNNQLVTYVVGLWFGAPMVALYVGCNIAVAPYWANLFDQSISSARVFGRRTVVMVGGVIGCGIVLTLIRFSLQSLSHYLVVVGLLIITPVVYGVVGYRLTNWWSLRCLPLELTDYTVSEMVPEIGEFNIVIEQSFSANDTNAHAEGIGVVTPTISLRENIFSNLPKRSREATFYHEIAHHKNNDQMKQSLLAGISFAAVFTTATATGWGIASIFGNQLPVPITILAIAIPSIIVLYLCRFGMSLWSRKAEYLADEYAANQVGEDAMIEALEEDETNRSLFSRLMSTHPSYEERVENLKDK